MYSQPNTTRFPNSFRFYRNHAKQNLKYKNNIMKKFMLCEDCPKFIESYYMETKLSEYRV